MATVLYGTTMEKARQIVREYLEAGKQMERELNGNLRFDDDYATLVHLRQPWNAVLGLGYDSFPVIREMLEENISYSRLAATLFFLVDGANRASEGDKEILAWMRKAIESDDRQTRNYASAYLEFKGSDAKDVELLRRYGTVFLRDDYGEILEQRIAGINVFDRGFGNDIIDNRITRLHLSVANTGLQGRYAEAILMKARVLAGMDESKIPAEILTIVITFDEDGNPVSSVDLAKYGLSMPVITPKPDKYYRGEYKTVFPHEVEATANTVAKTQNIETGMQKSKTENQDEDVKPETETPSPNHTWLYLVTAILILGIGGFYVWRKKKTRN
jgi:hypothetical protein